MKMFVFILSWNMFFSIMSKCQKIQISFFWAHKLSGILSDKIFHFRFCRFKYIPYSTGTFPRFLVILIFKVERVKNSYPGVFLLKVFLVFYSFFLTEFFWIFNKISDVWHVIEGFCHLADSYFKECHIFIYYIVLEIFVRLVNKISKQWILIRFKYALRIIYRFTK